MVLRQIVSRALVLRSLNQNAGIAKQSLRNGSHGVWSYRVPPPLPSKRSVLLAEVLGGFCWFWILYHIATEPEHIYGEWPYVDPITWTDEELGVPPDSLGPLKQ